MMLSDMRVGGARAQRLRPMRALPTQTPLRVAVSGGIGTGKSTFSAALRPFALAFADADEVAREVVAPGSGGLAQILARFGEQVTHADGSLNRAALAGIVFNDEAARADLEAITHPRIASRVRELLDVEGRGFTVYDVPLLLSDADVVPFHEVIMVCAPLEVRLERLELRGLAREDAQRRIEAQISDEQRRALATIVVENTGSPEDLAELAVKVATRWLSV